MAELGFEEDQSEDKDFDNQEVDQDENWTCLIWRLASYIFKNLFII